MDGIHPATPARGSRHRLVTLAVASVVFGYAAGDDAPPKPSPPRAEETRPAPSFSDLNARYRAAGHEVVRVRIDPHRQRLWVLTDASVDVYDTRSRALLRRVALPNWSVAGFDSACPPDIALDRSGSAFVSSNVEPRLLQIDSSTFETREHELRLVSARQLEIGFGALRFTGDGTLLALSGVGGIVFRIDPGKRSAVEIGSARAARACDLADRAAN